MNRSDQNRQPWPVAEFCGVAEAECLDPAGFGTTGGIYDNTAAGRNGRTRVECSHCGARCCAECRTKVRGEWLCVYCADRVKEEVEIVLGAMGQGR